jgi:hypothetical protein
MKGKTMLTALMLLFVAIFAMASVSAQIVIDDVEIDDDSLDETGTSILNLERGEEWEVKVHFSLADNGDGVDDSLDEIEIEVELTGYDGEDVRDTEYVDEVTEGDSYIERLTLDLPNDMEQQEQYTLRVYICPRSGSCTTATYELDVEAQEDDFEIVDVDFSPGLELEAGRALLTTVRVENAGDEDDDDGVKITVDIDSIGSASDWIDEVDEDDSVSSEELYIRVPSSTAAGDYEVEVCVEYDDGDETECEYYTLTVTADEEAEEADEEEAVQSKTVITVGPEEQDMTAGQGGAVYPVTLTNAAGEAKTYVVGVSGYDSWGTVRLDPSNVVLLEEGETQTVYLFVSADEEASGTYTFAVTVSAGSETLKQMLLTANVEGAAEDVSEEAGSWDSVKKGLEVGLIVLVILLVILGLIIVVNKLRQDDDEDEESKTYY